MTIERLGWLAAKLDDAANRKNEYRISSEESRIAIHIVPTNEEEMIAQHTLMATRR